MNKSYTSQIKELGQRVKSLREGRSFTQQELADKCDVDTRTIQRIERGDSGIGLHILFALADAFEIPASELLTKNT